MRHPAILMIQVWVICLAAFYILPFELVNRSLPATSLFALAAAVAVFCVGTLMPTPTPSHAASAARGPVMLDFTRMDKILIGAILISIVLLIPQIVLGTALDLEGGWLSRSERANDVLLGAESTAGILFQLSFLFYPASHIYIVREIAFRRVPSLVRIGLLGFVPVILMSMVMGGRAPILYTLILIPLTLMVRRRLFARTQTVASFLTPKALLFGALFVVACLVATNYFVQVFIIRFESVGGIDVMFEHAAANWGVTFSGPLAESLETVIGRGNTYLLFVFAWYFVQGIVMFSEIFANYDGPAQNGIFGIELMTSAARRLDSDSVRELFNALIDINVAGFSPSAFGSLYVDLLWLGAIVVFLWGYLAALVYRRTRQLSDPRWFLLVPFITLGIIFSPINTPLGFANGTVIHVWLVIAFFTLRSRAMPVRRSPLAA